MLSYSSPPQQLFTLTISFKSDSLCVCGGGKYSREEISVKSYHWCKMETYITKIINTILSHTWTCVIVTSADLGPNGLQSTTPRDNLAVSEAVFAADVISETALFYEIMQSVAGALAFQLAGSYSRLSEVQPD